jgi:pyrrolysine biosynthesis protein PylD
LTRLTQDHIRHISSRLEQTSRDLKGKTGQTLLEIACHAWDVETSHIQERIKSFHIDVVPITSGLGIISDFSETVAAILGFMGFDARVADAADVAGIARAFEGPAHAVMMADDDQFVGINLSNRRVADNSEATGRVFAAVLDLMAKGIKDREVLVMGCGPVGEAGARWLLSRGARVALCDIHPPAARALKERLTTHGAPDRITLETAGSEALLNYGYILEATPSSDTIPDKYIRDDLVVAAPGVPPGVSETGRRRLKDRLVHDTLELGVAAMAICLVK